MSVRPSTATLRDRAIGSAGLLPQCAACDFSSYTDHLGRQHPDRAWSHLEVAHVVPRSSGGSDESDNLVILCTACHTDAPNTTSRELFSTWLSERRASRRGPGHQLARILVELEASPEWRELLALTADAAGPERRSLLQDAVSSASTELSPVTHWGQPGWNYETERAVAMHAVRAALLSRR
jgi:hypothetical protein